MAGEFQPFVIRVDVQREGGYPVRAEFQGASWTETIPDALPRLSQQEIQHALQWLERGFIDRDYARDFGSRLFATLFQGTIEEGFRIAFERAASEENGLRIVLTLPHSLAGIPWELMYDEGEHGFLARSTTAQLVRHLEVEAPAHKLPEKGPLRILVVTASPDGYPAVSSEQEIERIARILVAPRSGFAETLWCFIRQLRHTRSLLEFIQRLRHRKLFEMDLLTHATRSSLQRQILDARKSGRGYHVIHFIGHGQADETGGYLILEGEAGEEDKFAAGDFAEMLAETTVNLALLNACQTALAVDLFQGVAQASLQRGVSAVIGMQVPVMDRVALQFAQEFYGAWAAGQPIEGALAYARRLITVETPGAAADWGIPVLFMGPLKSLTLNLETEIQPPPPLVRFLRWGFVAFFSIISGLGLVFSIPQLNKQVRTQVPIIRCLFPYPMESGLNFNVVVSGFSVLDKNGRREWWRYDGRNLAYYLYQELDSNFPDLGLGNRYEIRPPGETCQVNGKTREERANQAADLAERISADVIVYGVIIDQGKDSQLIPEFYVNYRGFNEAEEIIGQHSLGRALLVTLPFNTDQFVPVDNPPLAARTDALSQITIGLAFYSIDNYDSAYEYFLKAEQVRGWLTNAGKELIYLLLGNARIRQASKLNSTAYLGEAMDYFDTALTFKPDYARAEVGKAGLLYLMAIGDPNDKRLDRIDLDKLDEATSAYEAALHLDDPPESAHIEVKVHYGLGKIYRARYLHGLAAQKSDLSTSLNMAKDEFETVLQEYKNGNARIKNLAGHSLAGLASLAWVQGDYNTAAKDYESSIDLVSPFYQAYYASRLGEVYVADCQIDLAIGAYERAVQIAESKSDQEMLTTYSTRLDELEQGQPQCGP